MLPRIGNDGVGCAIPLMVAIECEDFAFRLVLGRLA